MSGSRPPQRISSKATSAKPLQYVAIAVICLAVVMALPYLDRLVFKKKAAETQLAQQAMLAGSGGGEPFHPPVIQDVEKAVSRTPPPPPEEKKPEPKGLVQSLKTAVGAAPKDPAPTDQQMFAAPNNQPPPQSQAGSAQRVAAEQVKDGSLASLLRPTEVSGYLAERLQDRWALIPRGRLISCHGVTAMTSQLKGFVSAKVDYDVRGVDGRVVLIDRDSVVTGEIAQSIVQGQDRFFVLWREVLTPSPNSIRITLNSPAADELGEAGLEGDINHHTMQKIGGALMLSGIEAGLQGISSGISQAMSHGNNNGSSFGGNGLNFYQFQGQGSSLASQLLSHTITIPDTLHRDQAMPCSIFTSGDLSFKNVYGLRLRAGLS